MATRSMMVPGVFGAIITALLVMSGLRAPAQNIKTATDPGVRSGAPGAGSPAAARLFRGNNWLKFRFPPLHRRVIERKVVVSNSSKGPSSPSGLAVLRPGGVQV